MVINLHFFLFLDFFSCLSHKLFFFLLAVLKVVSNSFLPKNKNAQLPWLIS